MAKKQIPRFARDDIKLLFSAASEAVTHKSFRSRPAPPANFDHAALGCARCAQIRKQFRLSKFLLSAVGEALHCEDSCRQFIISDDDGVARLQSIREAQRFAKFHLDRRQFDNETRFAQTPR